MSRVWLVDIGNTRAKWLESTDDGFLNHGFVQTEALKSGTLPLQALPMGAGDTVWVASVVPQASEYLHQLLTLVGCRVVLVTLSKIHQKAQGVVDLSLYESTLGVDRALNVLGARLLDRQSAWWVCDFGTTVTFDAVDTQGVFQGGAIAPGIRLFGESLASDRAAQLYAKSVLEPPERTPGICTHDAIASGLYWGYSGMISGVLQTLGPNKDVQLLLTGGDAPGVFEAFPHLWPQGTRVSSDVTFQAMAWLAQGSSVSHPL